MKFSCLPSRDSLREMNYHWMFYGYLLILIGLWIWQGYLIVTATSGRVHVACTVISIDGLARGPQALFEIVADFQELNSERTTGNVTVLESANFTQALTAVRDFALGTEHVCVYSHRTHRLYYEAEAPPDHYNMTIIMHTAVFVLLAICIVTLFLHVRSFRKQSSVLISHTPGAINGGAPQTQMIMLPHEDTLGESNADDGDDEDDILILFKKADERNSGAAVLVT